VEHLLALEQSVTLGEKLLALALAVGLLGEKAYSVAMTWWNVSKYQRAN
jgi:hypothetical protein